MNRPVVSLALAAIVVSLLSLGCERQEPEDIAIYDPQIDGKMPPLAYSQNNPELAMEAARLALSGAFDGTQAATPDREAWPAATQTPTQTSPEPTHLAQTAKPKITPKTDAPKTPAEKPVETTAEKKPEPASPKTAKGPEAEKPAETVEQPDEYGIVKGTKYRLPDPVTMRIGGKPGEHTTTQMIEAGTKIKVIDSYERGQPGMGMIYYQIEAYTDDDKQIAVGWISVMEMNPTKAKPIEE